MSENLELYPRLVVDGADAALEFCAAAFGATVIERSAAPDGTVVHALLDVGPARFAVKDADGHDPAPGDGATPVVMALHVTDADAVAARMLAGGAEMVFPVTDHDYGDRAGRPRDPFGHLWMIAQRLG